MKLLVTAASLILTCIVIGIGFINFRQSKAMTNLTASKLAHFQMELIQSEIKGYDGLEVRGSDVINFYKKHFLEIKAGGSEPFSMTVKTSLKTNTYKDGTYLSKLKDSATLYYIKPSIKFIGIVKSNDNGIIINVTFEQK